MHDVSDLSGNMHACNVYTVRSGSGSIQACTTHCIVSLSSQQVCVTALTAQQAYEPQWAAVHVYAFCEAGSIQT